MKRDEIKAGALLSYLNLLIGNLIPFIYTPIMLRMLGQAEYGIYGIAQSVMGYIGLLNFGIGGSIIRYLAKYRAETGMKVNAYRYDGVALFNESTTEFFHNSLALIRPEIRHGLFAREDLTIYTKVRDEVPAYYGEHSEIDYCVVADGCVLEGSAVNSVLFRSVKLGEGASVRNSVIMQRCTIGEGADLECVVMDMDVVVRPGAVLRGTMDHPLVFKRGEVV